MNARTGSGSTLLIDAVRRGDGFAAQFLLDQPSCDVNRADRSGADTALHLASTYADTAGDAQTYAEMLAVARRLVEECGADVNVRNEKG